MSEFDRAIAAIKARWGVRIREENKYTYYQTTDPIGFRFTPGAES